jgi:hypothetical protein
VTRLAPTVICYLLRLALLVCLLGSPLYSSFATTPATQIASELQGASREQVAQMLLLPKERHEYEIARKEIWLYPNGQQVIFHHGRVSALQTTVLKIEKSPSISSSATNITMTNQREKLAYDIFRDIQTFTSSNGTSGKSVTTPMPPNGRLRVPSVDNDFSEESEE